MKRRTSLLVLAILSALLASSAAAQMVFHSDGEGGGDVLVLQELGIVVRGEKGSDELTVAMLLPDRKQDVSIQEGDLVLMIDGKRVKDIDSLRAAYEAAEIGSTVKLGIRRGDERFLAKFEKQEANHGGTRVMIAAGGPGSPGEIVPLPEFGAVVGEKEGSVVVSMTIPSPDGAAPAFEEGDVVKRFDGKDVGSLADLRDAYEGAAVGADIVLVAERDGREVEVARKKIDTSGMIRVRRAP